MIKPEELRVGNWVIVEPYTQKVGEVTMSQSEVQICQITGIQKVGEGAILQVNNNIFSPIPIEHVSGIPLNEDNILKLGFSDKEYKTGYIGKDFKNTDFTLTKPFVMGEFQKEFAFQFEAGGWPRYMSFKYVHELQNFFYCYANEELNFDIK